MSRTQDLYRRAVAAAEAFNKEVGAVWLRAVDPPAETVTFDELRALAERQPGDYLAASAFHQIKGRAPTRAEAIKLGHQLGHLTVARKKSGPHTLWRLDKAFAQRSH